MTTYYELINPSDHYTLSAADVKDAALVAILLGSGQYGLKDERGAQVLPIFLGCGPDELNEWLRDQYGSNLDQLIEQADKTAIADCFESVVICPLKDRRLWDMALKAIDDPDKRAAWLAAWHDAKRSSMNDIGGRAQQYAALLREMKNEVQHA